VSGTSNKALRHSFDNVNDATGELIFELLIFQGGFSQNFRTTAGNREP